MSANSCLALLLDGPMQSWGYSSRFERRTTALHPTRSGTFGLIAAALGVDKHSPDESRRLEIFRPLSVTTVTVPRRTRLGHELPMRRLEDYHTVTGIRRASGKEDDEATVQTYRHYLLDARFGVLLEGPMALLEQIAAALANPKWGTWLGRKCCIPASPIVVGAPGERAAVWKQLLLRAGYLGVEELEEFERVLTSGKESIFDQAGF